MAMDSSRLLALALRNRRVDALCAVGWRPFDDEEHPRPEVGVKT